MARGTSTSRTSWLPFALCLLLTAAAAVLVGYTEGRAEQASLERAAISASDRIRERMASYVSVLRGSAGLLGQPQPVTGEEFRDFIARLKLPEHYPGTLGIGYTVRFGAITAAEATSRAQADGWPDVTVWPETPRDEVHAIVMLEPLDARNRAALGYDMRTEPTRREAMDRARDEGDVVLSGKVTLVQEIAAEKQPGFLLYSPIYEGGTVPASRADRRDQLKGYVYAPLRAGDLFEGIFGDGRPAVAFELYDGALIDAESRLYAFGRRIAADEEAIVEGLPVAGRTWTARFVRAGGAPPRLLTLVVAALGLLLSAVVLVVTLARERARGREVSARAEAMASEEMLRLNDMFIGILGHDLRTPLGAITLSAERLLKKAGGQGDAVASLQRILASATRMTRMIDQLLDLTRTRLGGGIRVAARPVELGGLVREVVDEVVGANPESPVDVVTAGDLAGLWDPDRLAQVFSNLLGNAVRHRLDRPVVVELDGTAPDRVVASVRNAGLIAPSLLPVVFEAFRGCGARAERTGSAGLGLGLYITRAIVEAHRGTIAVVSAEPAGTVFTVTLPRRPGAVVSTARSSGWRRKSAEAGAPGSAGGAGVSRDMSRS